MMSAKRLLGLRPCTRVYLLLILLSCTTYLIGRLGFSGLGISLLVLLLALFKGQLVGHYFMGLGSVRGWWRWPVLIWLFVPGGLIGAAFILAAA
ncbi:MAG: cytochrome C oxidase subunit IV family protein [Chromatiales bacterium]|jgi:hypothetical protein